MKQLYFRYSLLTLSLYLVAFGVSLISHSNLGAPPISCLAFVLSLNTPFSLGFYMLGINLLLIIGQLLLLGRNGINDFKKELIMQLPVSILFSIFIDISMRLVATIHPSNYLSSLAMLIAGCCVLAIGIVIEVIADVAMNSGEYIVQIAAKIFNKEFGIIKLTNDIILVFFAVLTSVLLSGGQFNGIGEGTLIVALLTGPLVRIFTPYFAWLRSLID